MSNERVSGDLYVICVKVSGILKQRRRHYTIARVTLSIFAAPGIFGGADALASRDLKRDLSKPAARHVSGLEPSPRPINPLSGKAARRIFVFAGMVLVLGLTRLATIPTSLTRPLCGSS